MLAQIRDYVTANPWLTAAVLYPLTTAIVSGVFHARSAGEYASKPARIAALYKLVAALGVDVEKATQSLLRFAFGATPKARAQALASLVAAMTIDPAKLLEALYQLVTGKRREDSGDGKPPSGGVTVLGIALCLALLASCRPSDVPRDQARATVLLVAKGVHEADIACAEIAYAKADRQLAQTCADAYNVARDALLGAESAVDAWDEVHRGSVACATAKGVAAMSSMTAAIEHAGGRVPPVVADAMAFSSQLAEVCRG